MMRDAESHAEEDRKRREEIETRNRADQAVYAAERLVRESGDRIPASDKAAIDTAVADLRKAIDAGDAAGMNRAMEALNQAQHRAAEAMYREAGTAAGGAAEPGSAGTEARQEAPAGGDGVIDAEVVEEEKK
jgi:molecular chaperone DnaK